MSATTGAAILGIIALLFTVASIVLALVLCKLLGKWFVWFLLSESLGSFASFSGFRRVYRRKTGLLHFQNKAYDVEIRG